MLIDWFTVGAQALNFIVLVWLLKRFLYQPVLDAIDAREARIAKQIADAQASERNGQAQRKAFKEKSDSFDRERAALLTQATLEADTERKRLVAEARQAADDLGVKRQEALEAEALRLDRDLAERARREVFAISRKALAELATTGLEEQITQVFIQRLRALDEPARSELAAALQASKQAALVRSAFELPAAQQEAIRTAVADLFGSSVSLRFEIAADLVGGVELVTGGQKLSWSIAHYLNTLEHLVSDVVAPQAKDDQAVSKVDVAQPDAAAR